MKILSLMYLLLFHILVSIVFSKIRRSRECKCKPTEYCDKDSKCYKKVKKGGACDSKKRLFLSQCENGLTCQQNYVTERWICEDSDYKYKVLG